MLILCPIFEAPRFDTKKWRGQSAGVFYTASLLELPHRGKYVIWGEGTFHFHVLLSKRVLGRTSEPTLDTFENTSAASVAVTGLSSSGLRWGCSRGIVKVRSDACVSSVAVA